MTANIAVNTYCCVYGMQVKKINSMGFILAKIIQEIFDIADLAQADSRINLFLSKIVLHSYYRLQSP